jgi:hypothetical protein
MRIAIAAAALLLSTFAAHAQRFVPSGQTIKLYFVASVNPDCSAAGQPTVRITKPPEHGRASVKHTRDFVTFQPSNTRSACNQRRVSGVNISYTAQRGYIGYDSVGVEIFYPSGAHRSGTFNVSVR